MTVARLSFLALLALAGRSLADDHALAQDDECQAGDDSCTLSALQVQSRALDQQEEAEEEADEEAEEEADEEIADEKEDAEDAGEGAGPWMHLWNYRTKKCLTVGGKMPGNRKQRYLVIDTCGKPGKKQRFRLNGRNKLQVKMGNQEDCVDLNAKGNLMTKDCTHSNNQEKWVWDKSKFGPQGWLETESRGHKSCIGVDGSGGHGQNTKKGVLVTKEKCDYFLVSDQKWEWRK